MRKLLALGTAAVLCAAAAGCGESGGTVARVGDAKVTRGQLEQTIEHFKEERAREGRPFVENSAVRRSLVGLLVYRARIEEGAAALGITISNDDVERRLAASPAEAGDAGEGEDREAFLQSTVRTQLLIEAVYRRLADRIHDTDPQRRQARRNAALRRWIASLETRYPVRTS